MRRRNLLTVGGGASVEGCLEFEVLSSTRFKFSGTSSSTVSLNTLQYSINGNEWQDLTNNTYTDTISVGSKIYFKGTCTPISSKGIGIFVSSGGRWNVKGTPMSLLYGDDFKGQTSLSGKGYAFYNLFSDCTRMISAENLSLPATTLAPSCYNRMFQGCSGLTTAPELPATVLYRYCYAYMFYNCTSLTTAPSLPATTLADSCYQSMFQGCSGLTTAPSLLATTLATQCYSSMFSYCTSLRTAPSLLATTLAQSCYSSMFQGCSGLRTAPTLPATILANSCYAQMFQSCTSLTTAPQLLATTLANSCYYMMFKYCSSLSSITCLATDISASTCTSEWVLNVASSGTFTTPSSTSWKRGNDGIPTSWTRVDA